MRRTIGAVTAGQSPRPDITGEMRPLLQGVTWIEHGALDGIEEAGLERLGPAPGEFPVITRIRGGRAVIVGELSLRPLLERAIARAAAEADLVLLLCSAPFAITETVPVLQPDRLLEGAVEAFGTGWRIAVLTPVAEQVLLQEERWRRLGFDPLVLHAPPYGGTDFAALGRKAKDSGTALAVFDCLGYPSSAKAQFVAASHLPCVLVRSLVARVAAELLE